MPDASDQIGGSRRINSLDSLRGIAAILVVFHHLALTFDLPKYPAINALLTSFPLNGLISGHSAVLVFFVLSGFALTLSLRSPQTYGQYAARRICRIYLPFACALCFAALLYPLIENRPVPALSPWFNRGGVKPLTIIAFLHHLFMIGKDGDTFLDGPMWSLIHEMRISLIFPLLLFGVRKRPVVLGLGIIVLYPLALHCYRGFSYAPYLGGSLRETAMATLYFCCFFIIGILMAEYRAGIAAAVKKVPSLIVAALLIAAWAGFSTKSDIFGGVAAIIFVGLAIGHDGIRKFLEHRIFRAAGTISYSLYLTHMIVLPTLFRWLYGAVDTPALVVLIFAASIVIGSLFYWLVEKPALRLSRYVGGLKIPGKMNIGTVAPVR